MESGRCSLSLPLVSIVPLQLSEFVAWEGDSGPRQHSRGNPAPRGRSRRLRGEVAEARSRAAEQKWE